MDASPSLEQRVRIIEERNARVERDKAWETSLTRILSIGVITYFIAVLTFWMIGNPHVLLNALVPTVGFVLSVQSLPVIKRWWITTLTPGPSPDGRGERRF